MSSVFSGLARGYTISRASAAGGTDTYGNPIPAEAAVSFVASLAVVTGGRERALSTRHGADPQVTYLLGECLNPATLPDEVTVGFSVPFTWSGRDGTLTIIEILIDPLGDILDEVVGQAFHAKFVT